jgi:putative salt-induced outer membrane protein YdiY
MDQDQTTLMSFGSSGECKLTWQMTKNISFTSRLFGFTDYGYIQADWENTLTMDINKFLKTQIYVHARYDSTTPRIEDEPNWHNLQVKEILSFGFTYSFKSV